MPHSLIHYLSDGQQLDFAVPFAYIKKDYVTAYRSELDSKGRVVGDRVPLAFSWLNAGTLRLDEAVPAGDRITIERETFADTPLVDYQDGTILPEDDLDLSTLQPLHVAQEARDRNTYEILQAAREFAVTAEEVKENAQRAEDAAADAEGILQECEDHLAAVEAAKTDARNSRDRAEAAASGAEAHATQVTEDRAVVERLASEVQSNAETVREETEATAENAVRVANWFPQIQDSREATEDAARRAEAAAEVAEQAAGIDTSAFARKDAMELALGTKADSAAVDASFEEVSLELAKKAPLDSPAFTGTPTAPTPTATDSSARIATTAFTHDVADDAAASAVNSIPTANSTTNGLMSASQCKNVGGMELLNPSGPVQVGFWAVNATTNVPVYKKTINTGALPNIASKHVAHGISSFTNIIKIEGFSTTGGATPNFLPIPWMSQTGAQILSIYANKTSVVLSSNDNLSAYATSYVTVYYY